MHPLADILIGLRFFSRLPVPATRREVTLGAGGLAAAAAMVPVAGLVIGGFPAAALLVGAGTRLPPTLAAALAVAVSLLVTGALHEDGLADCADGFGGGATRERKLEIMRDSRIGTYGACAIVLSLMIRVAAIGTLALRDAWLAAMVIAAAAAVSRTACLAPLVFLTPARADGRGASAAQIDARSFAMALAIAAALALLPVAAGASLARCAIALAGAAVTTLVMMRVAERQIGGHTGDVAGATQQLTELTLLVVYVATP